MDGNDEAQDEHKRFLEENHARIAKVAREGFVEHGRGAVFVFEDAILDAVSGLAPTVTLEYVADGSDALRRRGGWPTAEHADLVAAYDPDASMLVLVGRRREGRDLFTYQMLFSHDESDA